MARFLMSEIYETDFEFAPTDEKIDTFADFSYGKLGCILAATQGMALVAQTAHWSAKGRNFYEDHILFERVYNAFSGLIDGIAEKAVGMSKDGRIVEPCRLMKASYTFVEETKHLGMDDPNARLFAAIEAYKKLVTKCYSDLKADGILTPGLENTLQNILDVTEQQEYLIGRVHSGLMG